MSILKIENIDLKLWQKIIFKFAFLQLQNREDAEDITQEVLLALINNIQKHQIEFELKSYVFKILKNKIFDKLREKYRHKKHNVVEHNNEEFDALLFQNNGEWYDFIDTKQLPPDEIAYQNELLLILNICINKLPSQIGQIFSLKEFMEMTSQEICELLKITKDNYWQCMSRARKQLQLCLIKNSDSQYGM